MVITITNHANGRCKIDRTLVYDYAHTKFHLCSPIATFGGDKLTV